MSWAWVIGLLAGLVTGVISGFGIGGGSLLILYLTAFAGMDQYTAGGLNLLYFLFCAPAALIPISRINWWTGKPSCSVPSPAW